MSAVLEAVARASVIPIVEIGDEGRIEGVLSALLDGGLRMAEIVLRTPVALKALALATDLFPDITIGAGTVRTAAEAESAIEAGARFIASPFTDRGVVTRCLEAGVEVFPGVLSPTEVHFALGLGVEVVKFFPAEAAGGVEFLRALAAPIPEARFIPTGGVTLDNLATYLSLPQVLACGTSSVCPRSKVDDGDDEEITRRARSVLEVVRGTRPEIAQ